MAEREQYLTIAVRDFLNEGGKLVDTGETADYYGSLGSAVGGIYYGLNGDPTADCVVTEDPYSDCLLLADDFAQYYLGRYARSTSESQPASLGRRARGSGRSVRRAGRSGQPARRGRDLPTDQCGAAAERSSRSSPARPPAPTRWRSGDPSSRSRAAGTPGRCTSTTPTCGSRAPSTSPAVTAGQAPTLQAKLSYDIEEDYDHVIVEAHTVGQDNWTTLPEAGGLTSTACRRSARPASCSRSTRSCEHYLTPGRPLRRHRNDRLLERHDRELGRLAGRSPSTSPPTPGQQVEVSISYVTDPGTGGAGVVVDDTRLRWAAPRPRARASRPGSVRGRCRAPPAGSPPAAGGFARSQNLFAAAISDQGHGAARLRRRTARVDRRPGRAAREGVQVGGAVLTA